MPTVGYATLQIIPSVRGIADELRQQLVGPAGDAGEDAGEAAGEGLSEKFKSGALAAGAIAGAALVAATVSAVEKEKISDRLSAQLGLSGKGAQKAGKLAGKLYSGAVVDSFEEGADAVRAVMGSGLVKPGETTRAIESITTKVADLASTFDQDLGGTATAATQLIRTGLAKNATEALDLITKGFQSSANKADDLLDVLNEYGTQFQKIGLTGKQAVGIMNQAIQGGARDADVVADAFKEFSLRAVDGSETTTAAFKTLGINAKDFVKEFSRGGTSGQKAMDLVFDKLRTLKGAEWQNTVANLFGGPGEDLGKAINSIDVSRAVGSLGKVKGAAKGVGDTIRSNTATQIELLKRQFTNLLGDVVQSVVLPGLNGLVTGVKATISAFAAGARWVRDYGAWFLPLIIAVGGLTLALNAEAIATAAVTAVFSIYRAAILAGTAVTQGFAAAQALLNSIMALNPITLIVIALVALGAALVVAWNKSTTFRNIVISMWNGIKAAALVVWNSVLKPTFSAIWTALQAVGQAAMWLWSNAIKPAFGFIGLAARVLFAVVATIVLVPLIAVFKLVSVVVLALWRYAFQPAFKAIGAVVAWLWTTIVKPYFAGIVAGFKLLAAVAKWLYTNVVKPVFTQIRNVVVIWWAVTRGVFTAVTRFLSGVLGAAFRRFLDTVIKPVWAAVKAVISGVWNTAIKPTFNALKSAVGAVGRAFQSAVSFIGRAWDKLKGIARKPVQYVVDVVYNNGIRKVWRPIAKLVGLGELPVVKFARGGPVWGAGTETSDSIPALLSNNEHVWTAKEVRGAGGHGAVEHLRAMAARGGMAFAKGGAVLPRFAKGGGVVDWLDGAAKKVGSAVLSGVDFLTSPGKAWDKATAFIREKAGKLGAGEWARAISQFPIKMLKSLKDKMVSAAKGVFGMGSAKGSVGAALAFARSQAGKPYQWGGAGDPSWDCSGFMSGIQKVIEGRTPRGRLWSTFSFQGNQAPAGWKRGLRSPFMIGVTNVGKGHTAGTLAGVNVESRGGDGVVVGRRARGYNSGLFQARYGFVPALKGFARGGLARVGETAWVGERGPELMEVTSRGTRIWSHQESLRLAAGMGPLAGYAKGTARRARGQVPGDLTAFTKSLTGSAEDISKAIKELVKDLKAAGGAGKGLAVSAGVLSVQLKEMAKQRDSVDARLAEAKQAASDQKKTAQDFLFGGLAEATSVADLIEGMRTRQATARDFQGQIRTLSKRDLSQDLIAQLVAMGPDSALAGLVAGASAGQIKQLNALAKSGTALSTSFGRTMADAMFDAGKNASKGFLAGLASQDKELQAAMDKLGASLVSSIKKKLKIKSPSRVTEQVGQQAALGVAVGMDATASRVAAAAARVADAAVPVAPATAGALAGAAGGLQNGQRLRLVVRDREFDAFLEQVADERVNAGMTRVRRRIEAGHKG